MKRYLKCQQFPHRDVLPHPFPVNTGWKCDCCLSACLLWWVLEMHISLNDDCSPISTHLFSRQNTCVQSPLYFLLSLSFFLSSSFPLFFLSFIVLSIFFFHLYFSFHSSSLHSFLTFPLIVSCYYPLIFFYFYFLCTILLFLLLSFSFILLHVSTLLFFFPIVFLLLQPSIFLPSFHLSLPYFSCFYPTVSHCILLCLLVSFLSFLFSFFVTVSFFLLLVPSVPSLLSFFPNVIKIFPLPPVMTV